MRSAWVLVPDAAPYPVAAIRRGLERLGLDLVNRPDADLLVTWSPWLGSNRHAAQRDFDGLGKPVVVVENGWLSPIRGVAYYQVARDGWNGTGSFLAGTGGARWWSWALPVVPWRDGGRAALVVGQWGHPHDRRNAPPHWQETLKLPPGWSACRRQKRSTRPLEADLAAASRCVVWTSAAASWAVLMGVPVHYLGPNLMVAALAAAGLDLDHPAMPEREPELERLAWAQWSADEIATGEPFERALAA